MKKQFILIWLILSIWILSACTQTSAGPTPTTPDLTSPYVSQLDSPVRGLSAQEVDDLLNGRGAGYARSAELNGYPGPRHVLDMKEEINLSPEVAGQIEVIFAQMEAKTKALGHEIVQREMALSQAFAENSLSEAEMQAEVEALARLYGQLRAGHLQAHFQTKPLLSAEQLAQYNELRGYTGTSVPPNHQHMQH
jgi:Spy/CpxP family protein refolding chaperone